MTDPRGPLWNWRYRERKAGRLPPPPPICFSCGRRHTQARDPSICCRCWERLTPEGRAYNARRVRETRARAKARAEAATAALEQPDA
jgi:hypothetical protein